MEIRDLFVKICVDGVLKEENKILERKGLTHALDFPNVFKIEWIKIVVRKIHDHSVRLENGPTKITKRIIQ